MKENWWDIGNIVTHEDYKGLGLLVELTPRSLVYMWTITKEALTFTRKERKKNRKVIISTIKFHSNQNSYGTKLNRPKTYWGCILFFNF